MARTTARLARRTLLASFCLILTLTLSIEYLHLSDRTHHIAETLDENRLALDRDIRILTFDGDNNKEPDPKIVEVEEEAISKLSKSDVSSRNLHLAQDDPRLVGYIQENNHIFPPSNEAYDLTASQPAVENVWNNLVAKKIIHMFKNKTGGYFIECGANDGQFLSNTLSLETDYQWTGLLVEGDPRSFDLLKKRHRKAWSSNLCLSITSYPQKVTMYRHKEWEALSFIQEFDKVVGVADDKAKMDYEPFQTQCFPLFTILSALKVNVVDYFSMDMEGAELGVLKTIPFDKVVIKVLSIEVREEGKNELNIFMHSKGYVLYDYVVEPYTHDHIYVHNSFVSSLTIKYLDNMK